MPLTGLWCMMPDDPTLRGCADCASALREAPPAVRIGFVAVFISLVGWALLTEPGQGLSAVGQADSPRPSLVATQGFDREHSAWTAIIEQYVKDGSVDYRGLVDRGRPALKGYLDALATAAPAESGWTRPERLAFWINAYNAFTIQLILDHYPVKSIRSIGLLPLAAFRTKFIPLGAGRTKISLNTIENDVLRAQFRDARVHFAIVCASKSCPALRSDAYRSGVLDAQLDDAARRFLADPAKNRWEDTSSTLHLSSIFKWFREDFERDGQTLPAFVNRYLPPSEAVPDERGQVRIAFLDYDWSLNGR